MSDDFATAMRRALQKTRAGDPGTATAIIRSALASGRAPGQTVETEYPPRAAAKSGAAPDRMLTPSHVPESAPSGLPRMGDLPGMSNLPGPSGFPGLSGLSGGARPARPAPVPEGARVERRRHAGPAGARDYRLFVPSPREDGLAGLVLMLHGCTQSPEDFALGTRMDLAAEAAGFVVAYPGQTGQHNAQFCWNWFRPEDQARGRGEPEILAGLASSLAGEFDLGGRVFVAGLSAGGAMAAVLAETHPDVFAAAGIHSGLPVGSARDVPSAFAAMRGQGGPGRALRIPAIVFHGTTDGTVSPANAQALIPGSGGETHHVAGRRNWSRLTTQEGSELWLVEGAGHAWFGGDPAGSYADPSGPDASAEMLRFFKELTDK